MSAIPNLNNMCYLCCNWRAGKCRVYKKIPQLCRRFERKYEIKEKKLIHRGLICGVVLGFFLGLFMGVLI